MLGPQYIYISRIYSLPCFCISTYTPEQSVINTTSRMIFLHKKISHVTSQIKHSNSKAESKSYMRVGVSVAKSCLDFRPHTPVTGPVCGFSRQKYCGFPCPFQGIFLTQVISFTPESSRTDRTLPPATWEALKATERPPSPCRIQLHFLQPQIGPTGPAVLYTWQTLPNPSAFCTGCLSA